METPDKVTTNQVRQILMNELGLSREAIRQITEQIVADTVKKHMANLEASGKLNHIVENAFQSQYRNPASCYETFRGLVCEAARIAAEKFVKENISFNTESKK